MKKFHIINIVAILLTALVVLSYRIFLPPTTGSAGGGFENRNVVEVKELTTKSWFSGEYTASITEWFTDTLPYRSELIDIVGIITGFYGEEVTVGDTGDVFKPIDLVEPDKENDIKPDNPDDVFDPLA